MSSTPQWYMAIGGQQVGPVTEQDVVNAIRSGGADATTLVFVAGMDAWTPLRDVPKFQPHLPAAAPPPPSAPPALAAPSAFRSPEIDYRIVGEDLQFVEVELDPGESVVAEAGALMYMTAGVQMETIFGDGSAQSQGAGLMGALLGAGRRILTGESLFMTVFTAQGGTREKVGFAAPYPGRIVPMDLGKLGGELVCQKDSFLCAARGVSIGIAFQKKLGVGLFGGEGFIMQRLQGDGLVFVHAGGMLTEMDLGPGQTLRLDTGCLVALQPSVTYDIQPVGGVKTALFGGEGLFFATLTGPGHVWLQSLPLSRMADRIAKAIPRPGHGRKEEGSVLDSFGIGKVIEGD
ncbi:MAG TPA: TIGR00266 family protein [Vicinamibacteria bacterium]|nr:TIGR00266 family protein [Vicinamibacteria bacterium]